LFEYAESLRLNLEMFPCGSSPHFSPPGEKCGLIAVICVCGSPLCIQHGIHFRSTINGYPVGLGDSDIMLEAKIFAVTNAIEVMSIACAYRVGYVSKRSE
jgi:hypothetical protein